MMSTQFYARYVPPALEVPQVEKDALEISCPATGSKKRKRDVIQGEEKPQSLNGTTTTPEKVSQEDISKHDSKGDHPQKELLNHEDTTRPSTKGKKKQRGAKYRSSATTEQQNGADTINTKPDSTEGNEERKHEKIRSKYEKSAKIASRAKLHEEAMEADEDPSHELPRDDVEFHGLVPLPQPPISSEAVPGSKIPVLPEWLANPIQCSSSTSTPFKEIPLDAALIQNLEASGHKEAFAIQSTVLSMLLPGPQYHRGDICVSAATGSGKTLAYALPIVQALKDKPITKLRALVVVPTRELVTQARDVLSMCSSGTHLKVGTAVGNRTIAEEQVLLIERDHKYDPEAYQKIQEKISASRIDQLDSDYEDNDLTEIPSGFVVDYRSKVDVLICTPGRLVDHMKSTKGFTLDHVQYFVVDEVDRLLGQNFQQWLDFVVPALTAQPKPNRLVEKLHRSYSLMAPRMVRKVVTSATLSRDMDKLLALKLYKPALVVLESRSNGQTERSSTDTVLAESQENLIDLPSTLKEIAVPVSKAEEKPLYLVQLLDQGLRTDGSQLIGTDKQKTVYPASDFTSSSESDSDSDNSSTISSSSDETSSISSGLPSAQASPRTPPANGSLIFTNTNEGALRLARLLALLRPSWAPLISTVTKTTATSSRKTLAAFRKRKLSIIVASDRASRGLDLTDLAQVINYDIPTSLTSYVHRVGRTARAGKKGLATTLVAHHEARWFWNEIGRGKGLRRSGKVSRGKGLEDVISDEDRDAYEVALEQLGREARGGGA